MQVGRTKQIVKDNQHGSLGFEIFSNPEGLSVAPLANGHTAAGHKSTRRSLPPNNPYY